MDAAQVITAELGAIRFVLSALVQELLDSAEDPKAAEESLLQRALAAADGMKLEAASAEDAADMRDAMRQRIATLILRGPAAHRRSWWPSAARPR